ncbi:MAG: ABC transporter permease [Planctomycetota bacterium]
MNIITIPLIYIVSITVGVLAARGRGGLFDIGSGTIMLGLYSVPAILAGTLMIAYLASSQHLHWFPASGAHDLQSDAMPFLPYFKEGTFYRGYLLDFAWHMVLPITCLTYAGFAFLTKVMRGSVLETISADFVRTARAKGVAEHHILFRHVLRNSLLPLITMAAAILPGLFVGSFVVEYIFSIQGMGLLTIEAAKNKDVNIMMATTLVGALLSLFSLLLRDILYAIADPRVSYE